MPSKPTLTVEHEFDRPGAVSRWYRTSVERFIHSGLFTVKHDTDGRLPRIRKFCRRDKYAGVFDVDVGNGPVQVLLDTWDSGNPTEQYWCEGFFDPRGPLFAVRLILKIQAPRGYAWPEYTRHRIKVVPWPIMNSRPFPLGYFAYNPDGPHDHQWAITGRNHRYGRQPYVAYARALKAAGRTDIFCPDYRYFTVSPAAYAELLRSCRWGLILRGKPVLDGKNMREPEMLSCGMPLVLNYQPHYLFPFEPDRHYVYIERPEDLTEKLPGCDHREYAERSREVWRDHYCPAAVSRKLIELVEEIQTGG